AAGPGEELAHLDALRAGNVALPRIARAAATTRVLLFAANVEKRQRRVVEAHRQLSTRRERAQGRLERGLAHRFELHRPVRELALPIRHAAEQVRDSAVPRELGQLRRRHGSHRVAAVDEHQALRAVEPVPSQTKSDLLRELNHSCVVGARRRRTEHERARAGNVTARVCVRPAHVADHEIVLAEMRGQPGRVDDVWKLRPRHRGRTYSAATSSASAATAGRASSLSTHAETASYGSSGPASMSRARNTQGAYAMAASPSATP